MKRFLLSFSLIFLTCTFPVVSNAQYSERAYAPENIGSISVRDQIRVIEKEYRDQSRGRQIPDDQLEFYLDQIKYSRWTYSRVKADIATSLRGNTGNGWIPSPGNNWNQQSVICSSKDNRYRECRTPFRNRARLIENISDTRCIEGQNWGSRQGLVWVDRGCRGRFMDSGNSWGGGGNVQNFRCESLNGSFNQCRKPSSSPAFLVRNLSNARCTENLNWGQSVNAVWVNGGCRGEFAVRSNGSNGTGNSWAYSVTCASNNGRYTTCAWDRNRGRPVLIQRLSSARCDEGRDWGYDFNRGLWVSNGCRARFGPR